MNPFCFILAALEKAGNAGLILAKELGRSFFSKERVGRTPYRYAVIRDQLEFCQNGGPNSPCAPYCGVPEGTRFHNHTLFKPKTISQIANFLVENKIHIAGIVGAEGFFQMPTNVSWGEGLAELKEKTAKHITEYFRLVLHKPIDMNAAMTGTELSIVKDAILKDHGLIVHRPTNGIVLVKDPEGKKLLPLVAKFVDHFTLSYHFAWDPESASFQNQNRELDTYLEFADFASRYTLTKIFRVFIRERDPVTMLAFADRVLQLGTVFFDYGIHDGKGIPQEQKVSFSKDTKESVPTQEQLEDFSLGMLARLGFMDHRRRSGSY